jgi:anti-sigma factor ChrR (cupin superfamily)
MFPYIALTKDKTWQPGPYDSIELMALHKNPDTNGVVVLRKFKAGHTIPAHTHHHAGNETKGISGDISKLKPCPSPLQRRFLPDANWR